MTPDPPRGLFDPRRVGAAYDAAAHDYVAAFGGDLDALPLDRSVLDRAVDSIAGHGPVLDLGCGPGEVADYLSARAASM